MSDLNLLVIGSGAAGLTAAITAHEFGASVAVYEKSELVGGTSAWSGGQIWIPNHQHPTAAGKQDSREEALTYFDSLSNDLISREMAETFVDTGPEMVNFLEQRTPVEFYCVRDFPDYHPELPGGKPEGGRTLECPPYSYKELGEWASKVQISPYFPDRHISVGESPIGKAIPTVVPEDVKAFRRENDVRGLGHALVGRLLKGCLDRDIQLHTEHRAVELLVEDGSVVGVAFETPNGRRVVRAKNVLLASGGFEWNRDLVRTFLRGPMTHPVSVPSNTGDGLIMAMRIGAKLGNMREAWWMPVVEVPTTTVSTGQQLFMGERTLPGSIMVNKAGRRFVNEASNYNAFGAAFHVQNTALSNYANLPCWMIFTQSYYEKWGFMAHVSTDAEKYPPEWIHRGNTLEELAGKLKIDSLSLAKTVREYNENARQGIDEHFHRGESANDCWWGDPNLKGQRAATLAPLGDGPYYAIEVKSGAIGTKGGPQTNIDAQVLNIDGQVIPGLYAAGNVMASILGMTYGGAGGTLGPAMVFAYRAGRHLASRSNS